MIIAIVIGIGIALWVGYELYNAPEYDSKGNVVDDGALNIMERDIENDFKNKG